jgi:hypothetical protein
MIRFLLFIFVPLFLSAENAQVLDASNGVIRIISPLDDKNVATGTAFCVSDDGIFLTNAHVVDGARASFAVKSSTRFDVEVVRKDDEADLAILKIKDTGLKPLVFSVKENIQVTDRVSSIGFPGAADKSADLDQLTTVTINSGIIGKLGKIKLSIRPGSTELLPAVQHDAVVNHGNSGGPLVDECGMVVGVNVQKGLEEGRTLEQVVAGDVVQGIFYAIDIDIAKKLLKSEGIELLENSNKCKPGGGISMGSHEQKYLIAGALVAVMLLAWSVLFALRQRRGGSSVNIGETYINGVVDRKIEGRQKEAALSPALRLHPMTHGMPDIEIGHTQRIIGRSSRADIILNNPRISSKHLSIVVGERGNIVVQDLGSSNGTYIEGVKLTPHTPYTLSKGKRLVIGSEDVIYTIQ